MAALLLVGGCSDDDPESGSATSTTAACAADDLDASELEAVTVTDGIPAGFERQPDDVGDTGPSDLAKAISDDGGEGAEEALAKFRRGYQWFWTEAEEGESRAGELISFVYEYCDEDGAAGYLARGEDRTESEATEVTEFDVSDVDGETAASGVGDGYRYAYADKVDGSFYVRVMAYNSPTSDPAVLQDHVGTLLVAQLAALDAL